MRRGCTAGFPSTARPDETRFRAGAGLPRPAPAPKIRDSPHPPGRPRFQRRPILSDLVLWLDELRMTDLGKVGGKNASLGEMIGNLAQLGVSVPGGFATTAQAFQD